VEFDVLPERVDQSRKQRLDLTDLTLSQSEHGVDVQGGRLVGHVLVYFRWADNVWHPATDVCADGSDGETG